MSQQNQPLCDVLNYLKKKHHLSQATIVAELSQLPTCTGITSIKLSQYKSLYIKELPSELITAFHELYNINPDYLRGTSKNMLDNAKIHLEALQNVIKNWTTIIRTPRNIDTPSHEGKYLTFTLDANFYNFLLDIDFAKLMRLKGLHSYDAELQKYKMNYNESQEANYIDYILIPSNTLWEIIENEKEKRRILDECLNYEEHFPFCDN